MSIDVTFATSRRGHAAGLGVRLTEAGLSFDQWSEPDGTVRVRAFGETDDFSDMEAFTEDMLDGLEIEVVQ